MTYLREAPGLVGRNQIDDRLADDVFARPVKHLAAGATAITSTLSPSTEAMTVQIRPERAGGGGTAAARPSISNETAVFGIIAGLPAMNVVAVSASVQKAKREEKRAAMARLAEPFDCWRTSAGRERMRTNRAAREKFHLH